MPNQNRARGRILPHERDTDDAAPLLGEALDVGPGYEAAVYETVSKTLEDGTRKNYRSRLVRIAHFWKTEHPEYYEVGVIEVSDADLRDPTKFFFNHYKQDLVYGGLNVKFVLDFLARNKYKSNGKMKHHNDIRKYKDAILWGASVRKQPLPTSFYAEMEVFLKGYMKETAKAKKDGNLDESSADPITIPLYLLLLQWSIEAGNVLLWFWTLSQWNCMARGASIDPLAFHNFKLGQDSVICK